MIWQAMAVSMRGVIPFIGMYLILLLAFSWSGHWLFGQRVYAFHSMTETFMYLILSVIDDLDYQALKDASAYGAPLFFFTWFAFSCIILYNLLIAIVADAFMSMKELHLKQLDAEAK